MGTRHNKKVDAYSNNKTWNTKPASPRATDAERALKKKSPLTRRKGKTWGHR